MLVSLGENGQEEPRLLDLSRLRSWRLKRCFQDECPADIGGYPVRCPGSGVWRRDEVRKGCECNTCRGDHAWNMFGTSLHTPLAQSTPSPNSQAVRNIGQALGTLEKQELGGRFGYLNFFFCPGKGKGKSEAPGGEGGVSVFFTQNPRRGGGLQGGGPRGRKGLCGKLENLGGGEQNIFFSRPKCPPSWRNKKHLGANINALKTRMFVTPGETLSWFVVLY